MMPRSTRHTDSSYQPLSLEHPDLECGLKAQTRRHFFRRCGVGVGAIALQQLMRDAAGGLTHASSWKSEDWGPEDSVVGTKPTHFAPRAKRVIFLFMAGGPSQLEMFDFKPELNRLNGQPIPQSFIEGKRFAFMDSSHRIQLLGTRRTFSQHGASGAWVSDLLPIPLRSSMNSLSSTLAKPICSITRPLSCL